MHYSERKANANTKHLEMKTNAWNEKQTGVSDLTQGPPPFQVTCSWDMPYASQSVTLGSETRDYGDRFLVFYISSIDQLQLMCEVKTTKLVCGVLSGKFCKTISRH